MINTHATPANEDSALIARALEIVAREFQAKHRKAPAGFPRLPYVVHLIEVAGTLAENGFSPAVIAAGLLHDLIEDIPGWSYDRVKAEFSEEIAELVWYVTQRDKTLPWEERNRAYNEQLKEAPLEALAISCADKVSNIGSALVLLRQGQAVDRFLKKGWKMNSLKFWELDRMFQAKVSPRLYGEFKAALEEFDQFGLQTEETEKPHHQNQ